MQLEAFWYKNGKLFEMSDSKHIQFIVKNPEKFGISKDRINDIYNKYNEPIGFEGKAREELIKEVASNGWIRIRHYSRPDYWSIQFDKWSIRKRDVKSLVEDLVLIHKKMGKYDELVLVGYEDNFTQEYKYQDNGAMKFMTENKAIKKIPIIEINEFDIF
jgi:hypothetical protein